MYAVSAIGKGHDGLHRPTATPRRFVAQAVGHNNSSNLPCCQKRYDNGNHNNNVNRSNKPHDEFLLRAYLKEYVVLCESIVENYKTGLHCSDDYSDNLLLSDTPQDIFAFRS